MQTTSFRLVIRLALMVVTLLATSLLGRGWAQQPDPAARGQLQAKLAEVKASLAANQQALRQYTWLETTEISLKGEVKSRKQNECRYGPDGQVQKKLATAPPEKKKKRGLRGKIVAKKVGELTDYMERAGSLVHRYVPPDPSRMQAAMKAGKGALQLAPGGKATLAFRDYAKTGDEFTLTFDTAAKKIVSVNVRSYLDGPEDAVTLSLGFTSLPDGTNYLSESILNAQGKQVQVKTTNFGHRKASS